MEQRLILQPPGRGFRRADLDFLKGILILLVITFHRAYIGDSYP